MKPADFLRDWYGNDHWKFISGLERLLEAYAQKQDRSDKEESAYQAGIDATIGYLSVTLSDPYPVALLKAWQRLGKEKALKPKPEGYNWSA